jgi:mono/diheme cytochrome c family protein
MSRRAIVEVALSILVVSLLVAACGSTSEPTAAPTQPVEEPAAAEPTQPAEEPTAAEPSEPAADERVFPPEMPSAVRGQAIFTANCASCHGEAGDGSGLAGAAVFTDLEFMRGEKPAAFYKAIRDGVEGTAMPAWGATLGEMEIWDVLYYEWAFATSPDEIGQGQALFADNCVACHGEAGDGSALEGAADFTDQEFMANENPAEFFEKVTEGVEGTAMPAWGETLSEDEIWSLVNFVWTFAYESGAGAEEPAPVAEAPTEEPTEPATEEATPTVEEPAPTTEAPTATVEVPTPTPELPAAPDPVVGKQVWASKPCIGCHGANAEGGIGPMIAGTPLEFDEVLLRVRTGAAPMPAFAEAEVSDLEVEHIYAWLQSLAPPTPTPPPTQASKPLPPSGHLTAFWEHVNRVKVHSDFAKDASPDIGALHGRVNQAVAEGNSALREADLAMADIPDPQVQDTIRKVKGLMNEILGHANAALATQDLDAARGEAAKMVEISRLDSWPLATLAVKQAGFSGSVRVQVKNPAGNPIQGALVTALTAPDPSAGITDANGRVTIPDLAAVRVMQVKAYSDGLVYHEVHVTVPTGGRADAEITLPGPSASGQTPAVSNASIAPSSGAGNAQVTFRMTGTDPQGHANIAEDQVFALNPDLGLAYVLRSAGGDDWATTVTLPSLQPGTHTWYFFIVDHQCNTSSIEPLTYTVQ